MNFTILSLVVLVAVLSSTNGRSTSVPQKEVKRPVQDDIIYFEPKSLMPEELKQSVEFELNRLVRAKNNNGNYHKGGCRNCGHKNGGNNNNGYKKGYNNGYKNGNYNNGYKKY